MVAELDAEKEKETEARGALMAVQKTNENLKKEVLLSFLVWGLHDVILIISNSSRMKEGNGEEKWKQH